MGRCISSRCNLGWAVLLLVMVLGFGAGCDDPSGTVDPADRDTDGGSSGSDLPGNTECTRDTDCAVDEYCYQSRCIPLSEGPCVNAVGSSCESNDDCEDGVEYCCMVPDCDASEAYYNHCLIQGANVPGQCSEDLHCPNAEQICNDQCLCAIPGQTGTDDDEEDVTSCDGPTCLSLDPTNMNFGVVQLRNSSVQNLYLCNTCAETLTIFSLQFTDDTSSDFEWIQDPGIDTITISPGTESSPTCNTYRVKVTPTDAGRDTGGIQIYSSDVCYPPNGKPVIPMATQYKGKSNIDVSPTEYNFGNIDLGDNTQTTITVTNAVEDPDSNKVLTILKVELNPPGDRNANFAIDEASYRNVLLAPYHVSNAESLQITVDYIPQSQGTHTSELLIYHDADTASGTFENPIVVPLEGSGVKPCLELEPATGIDFGQVSIGSTVSQEVTLRSTCQGIVETGGDGVPGVELQDEYGVFELNLHGSDSGEFRIPPNQYVKFSVKCSPNQAREDPYQGVIAIHSNDEQGTQYLSLSCKAVMSHIEVNPSSCNYNLVDYNITEPKLCTIEVTNMGAGDLLVQQFLFGEGCEDFQLQVSDQVTLPRPIPPNGGSEEFVIEYMPLEVDELNGVTDTCQAVMITDNSHDPEWPIPLVGTPIAPLLELSLERDANFDPLNALIDWGEIPLNSPEGYDKVLILKNKGRMALQINNIRLAPETSQYFTFSPHYFPPTGIALGGTEEITVNFQPMVNPGILDGKLVFETNDYREPYFEVSINLTGKGVNPTLEIVPSGNSANPVDMGQVMKNACSPSLPMEIYNDGQGKLQIYSIVILQFLGGTTSSWNMTNFDPSIPATLHPFSTYGDELNFNMTFCPSGLPTQQDMILGVCSNDYLDVKNHPGYGEPGPDNDCPEGYGWREVYFRGDGKDCDEGWHDLDDNPADCEYPCTETLNRVEYCDGLDNDCNGIVDDGYTVGVLYCNDPDADPNNCCDPNLPGDPDCCEGEGVCGVGVWECDPISKLGMICSSDINGSEYFKWYTPEYCDHLDNDCDGEVDEDWGVDDWCLGDGECGLGHIECAGSSSTRCSTNPGGSDYDPNLPIRKEVCDGNDNDCDGEIDNGIYYIREDAAGICDDCINRYCKGEGDCQSGVFRCDLSDPNQMTVYCTGNDAGAEYEVCNNSDDDCDGEVDEVYKAPNNNCPAQVAVDNDTDMVYLGCTCQGIGQCGKDYSGATPINKYGVGQCDPENQYETICSTSPGGTQDRSTEERCDGIDNDCDGEIDEDFNLDDEEWPCYAPGECGIKYVDGQRVPRAGVWECDPYGSGDKICSTGIGGSEYPQVSGIEVCDEKDNDCNGYTDDIPGLNVGQACVGTGECRLKTGVLECKNLSETQCSVDPGGSDFVGWPADPAREEICDGKDNDCDGIPDNGYNIGTHCLGVGTCSDGHLECDGLNPRQTVCSTLPGGSQYFPEAEVCDGIDNDCDGKTDEDFIAEGTANKCKACGTCGTNPETEDLIFGHWECDASDPYKQRTICSTEPGGSDYNALDPERVEICDGLDNDCDCWVDEGFSSDNDDINNCGGCGKVCNAPKATSICDSGVCKIESCNPKYYDIDNEYDTGCECETDNNDQSQRGDSCSDAVFGGEITDLRSPSGSQSNSKPLHGNIIRYRYNAATGQTCPSHLQVADGDIVWCTDVDWFRVKAIDSADSGADDFYFRVAFSENPRNQYRFEVYASCSERICPTDPTVTTGNLEPFTYAYDFYGGNMGYSPQVVQVVDNGYLTVGHENNDIGHVEDRSPLYMYPGQSPCDTVNPNVDDLWQPEESNPENEMRWPWGNRPIYNLCSREDKEFYIKVFRAEHVVPSCDPYVLQVSNAGEYSTSN